MMHCFVLIPLAITLIVFFIQSLLTSAQSCPSGCRDIRPPGQPYSCKDINEVFGNCGTAITAGDRYCKCTCGTCPQESWVNINASAIATPSPSPVSAPLKLAAEPLTIGANIIGGKAVSIPDDTGLSVGGSRGIDTFRRNIENNIMPQQSDITYEGIFNDYFFDTSGGYGCDELLCAKYSGAISADPISSNAQKEFYLAVGLQSAFKDFKRKDLNLLVVLDVSISMKQRFGFFQAGSESEKNLRKINVAKQAIKKVLDQLTNKDKFGVVTFAKSAKVVVELAFVTPQAKVDAINRVNKISAKGPTNLQAGIQKAAILLTQELDRENRLIIITDANANRGEYSPLGLAQIIADFSTQTNPIFTTVIGVGLNFNTQLTDKILQTRGANYFSVYSPAELRSKLDKEFDFLVTPLAYDFQLQIEKFSLIGKNGWKIIQVIGVPSANQDFTVDDTVIFNVNTLFPSLTTSEGSKGAIILIQLQPKSSTPSNLYISLSYKDPNFVLYQGQSQIGMFLNFNQEFYSSSAIQKAILLKRYVGLMRKWISETNSKGELKVSDKVGDDFVTFFAYILSQNNDIEDDSLSRETAILRQLIGVSVAN